MSDPTKRSPAELPNQVPDTATGLPEVSEVNETPEALERSLGSRLFLGLLGVVSLLYAAVLIYHVSVPPGAPNQTAFLEQCREICLKYGLVSTGNVKHDARAYLTAVEAKPLSQKLSDILSDPEFRAAESEPHSLLGKEAPDFELLNESRNPRHLKDLLGKGPVMLVFYYGFSCSHCVAQLYAIEDDFEYFRELDVQIVAICQEKPEQTAAAIAEYGRFDFMLLSDPGNQVSRKYGCFKPDTSEADGFLKHGTFLLDRDGSVRWAATGFTPFVDNRSLLIHLAKLQDRQPATLAAR